MAPIDGYIGWSLTGFPVVQRLSERRGTPQFNSDDRYFLNGERLIGCPSQVASASCSAGGDYYPKVESYVKVRHDTANDRWEVWGKDGTKTTFSPTLLASAGTLRWSPSSVTDPFGNTVSYTWFCSGECFPDTISYNGYTVRFYRQARPDILNLSLWNVVEDIDHRIRTIEVRETGGDRIRAYALGYQQSPLTGRSLLTSVTQYGRDVTIDAAGAITGGSALPATTFTYSDDAPGFQAPASAPSQEVKSHLDCSGGTRLNGDFNGDGFSDTACVSVSQGVVKVLTSLEGTPTTWLTNSFGALIVGDFNGDGKADLADHQPWTGDFRVALSTGTSFSTPAFWGTSYAVFNGFAYHCRVDPARVGGGDMNGDGLGDVWCQKLNSGEVFVGRSTGTSFSFSIFAELVCGPNYDQSVGLMDYDGDRMDDWYCIGEDHHFAAYRSTGSSFVNGPYLVNFWCSAADYVFGDLNADGLTDAYCKGNGNVALSSGIALHNKGSFGAWCTSGAVFAADVDGDGTSELVCNAYSSPTDDITVRKFHAKVLQPATTWKSSWCPAAMRPWDQTGDGKADFYCPDATIPQVWAGTPGVKADLMIGVATPLGGSLSVEYAPASSFPNNPDNPGPVYAVTELTTDDGRGGSATTLFEYRGGKQDRGEGRFLGFAVVTQTLPCLANETQCPQIETWYSQDLRSLGYETWQERRNGAGGAVSGRRFVYTLSPVDTYPRKALLWTERHFEWDGTAPACPTYPCPTGRRVELLHTYDVYGNRTERIHNGDPDLAGDEVTTAWGYVPNTSAYIVGAPAWSDTYAGAGTSGTRLAATHYHYDGATTWASAPTKGALTQTRGWLSSPWSWKVRTMTYDAWGNLLTDTDPTGRTQTYAYDASKHLFLVAATDPAGQTAAFAWNEGCGVPTQTTDANGQTTTFQTDVFCRPTSTTTPLGGSESRSYVALGDPAQQRVVTAIPSATPGDGTGDQWATQYIEAPLDFP